MYSNFKGHVQEGAIARKAPRGAATESKQVGASLSRAVAYLGDHCTCPRPLEVKKKFALVFNVIKYANI